MYEFGMRLGREIPGVRGLQRQASCYLAAMNALRLVSTHYQWIVKVYNFLHFFPILSHQDYK